MILHLHATPEEVMRAVETLQALGRQHGVGERDLFGLALALEECGSNIVNHAFQRDARRRFQVAFELTRDTFVIELRDRGPAFDPTAAAERDLGASEDDLPGGWGIQLVRRYLDEIRYRREGGENVLRLAKRLLPACGGTELFSTKPRPSKAKKPSQHATRNRNPTQRRRPERGRDHGQAHRQPRHGDRA